MIKSSISVSCKILVSHFAPIITRRNISLHAKLSRMPNIVKFLGLNLAERLSMSFPEQLLNGTILSVSYRICLRWTTLIFDDPMDATAYQIRLTSPHLLCKLPVTAWRISNSWRRSYNQLLVLLGLVAWSCRVSSEAFFPWNDTEFQEHFPHGITMSVLDLKAFSGTVLLEILVQLANLKVRYHFMNYRRLAIFGPASLVINLHLALLPLDVHLPIGPKQGAFTIHMMIGTSEHTDHQWLQPFPGEIWQDWLLPVHACTNSMEWDSSINMYGGPIRTICFR